MRGWEAAGSLLWGLGFIAPPSEVHCYGVLGWWVSAIPLIKMLTRLKVSGFKNLIDVDVSFGPFTCIAGANGVGKSNLLDAIVFLSALADRPLIDAALSVRDQGAKTGDI